MKCANKLDLLKLQSPIGVIVVELCKDGLHSMNQSPDINDSNFSPRNGLKVEPIEGSLSSKCAKECASWLETYFNNPLKIGKTRVPHLCTINSNDDASFYDKVYSALLKVPFGQTVSYKQLAALAGSPNAVRAVGSAMARNPLQVLVPCHRVLPSPSASGRQSAGNYSSGKKVTVKHWLLRHEGLNVEYGFIL